jgi:hypothetical protein
MFRRAVCVARRSESAALRAVPSILIVFVNEWVIVTVLEYSARTRTDAWNLHAPGGGRLIEVSAPAGERLPIGRQHVPERERGQQKGRRSDDS